MVFPLSFLSLGFLKKMKQNKTPVSVSTPASYNRISWDGREGVDVWF